MGRAHEGVSHAFVVKFVQRPKVRPMLEKMSSPLNGIRERHGANHYTAVSWTRSNTSLVSASSTNVSGLHSY